MMGPVRHVINYHLLWVGLPWLLWMLPNVMGGVVTFNKFILQAPGMVGKEVMYCAHNATNGTYVGIRMSTSGDVCEPVTNADFYTNGEQAGYQYSLKRSYLRRATPPDNIAPNPYANTYIEIPGVFNVGTSIEYIYTKTAAVSYTVEFVDEEWQALIMKFHVMEPSSVVMTSLNYVTSTWGADDYPSGFPFTALGEYRLKFTFTTTDIEVFVNGNLYHQFGHRFPYNMLRWVRFLMKPHSTTSGLQVSDVRVTIP